MVRDKVTGQIKPMAEVDLSLANLANQAQQSAQRLPEYIDQMVINYTSV